MKEFWICVTNLQPENFGPLFPIGVLLGNQLFEYGIGVLVMDGILGIDKLVQLVKFLATGFNLIKVIPFYVSSHVFISA